MRYPGVSINVDRNKTGRLIKIGDFFTGRKRAIFIIKISEALVVAGNYFVCRLTMDFTPKGGARTAMEELALYKVENGKIVSEQFFY